MKMNSFLVESLRKDNKPIVGVTKDDVGGPSVLKYSNMNMYACAK